MTMADDPATSALVRPASPVLELTAKAAGAVAAVSALVGVTYNVAFFVDSKQAWLFYLSVTDNLTATLYALPLVALVGAMMVMSALGAEVFTREPPPPGSAAARRVFIWRVAWPLILVTLIAFIVSREKEPLWSLSLIVLGFTISFLSSAAWKLVSGKSGKWMRYETRASLAAALVTLPLVLSVCLFARSARDQIATRGSWVDIELSDKQVIRGIPIRALEGGVILAQGELWIWLPRSEIKKVTEIGPQPASAATTSPAASSAK
jgi:hypothetical protein